MKLGKNKIMILLLLFFILFVSVGSASATSISDYNNEDNYCYENPIEVSEVVENTKTNNSCVQNENIINESIENKKSVIKDTVSSLGATKTSTTIAASNFNQTYQSGKYVTARLKTSSGSAIKSKVIYLTFTKGNSTKTYNRTTNSTGYIKLQISLNPGTYSCLIKFKGDSTYAASNKTITVVVRKWKTRIDANSLTMSYLGGNKLTATLRNSTTNNTISGKKLTYTFTKTNFTQEVTATTSNSGVTNLIINLKPGTYTCVIKYAGDTINETSSKTVTVTVNKGISTLISEEEYHIYDESYILEFYLINSNDEDINEENLTLVINNSTYFLSSDSEGNFYFDKIYLLDYGEYNCSLIFEGNEYYNPSTAFFKLKKHNGETIDLDVIISCANNIINYVEINHNLPENINLEYINMSLDQFLNLITLSINNINNELDTNILLEKITSSNRGTDSLKKGYLNKTEYLNIVTEVLCYCQNGTSPTVINTSLGDMNFKNLIYVFSSILKSYSTLGVLPEYITVYPWTTISNNSTIFISMDSIFNKSSELISYIEYHNRLPDTLTLDNIGCIEVINEAQFLKLELDLMVSFSNLFYHDLILGNYSTAPNPTLYDTISICDLSDVEYYDVALRVIRFMENPDNNFAAPNYASTNYGNFSFYSMIYTYSNILNSIIHTGVFPSLVHIYPWNVIGEDTTIFVSMEDIYSISSKVKECVLTNYTLPNYYIEFKRGLLDVYWNYLSIEIDAILNLNNNLYQSVLLGFNMNNNTFEDIHQGTLNKSDYITVAMNIKNFLLTYNIIPNYASCSLGKLSPSTFIFMFSEILDYAYYSNNHLPDTILVNPWIIVSDSSNIIFNISDVINASNYIINYVESNHNLPLNITLDNQIINQYQMLRLLVSSLGIINSNYTGELYLENYTSSSLNDSLNRGIFNQSEYLKLASLIEKNLYNSEDINENTDLGIIGIDNAVYIFSQILSSYDSYGVLPSFINVNPWNLISNDDTYFVSLIDVLNASSDFKNYIEHNNCLPNSVVINDNSIDISSFTYLLANTIKMIYGNLSANILVDKFNINSDLTETLNPTFINFEDYLELSTNLINCMNNEYSVPSYLVSDYGNIRYESLALVFATVLEYYNYYNGFVNNTIILPWDLINSNKFYEIEEIINVSNILKYYIEKNHSLPDNIVINNVELSINDYVNMGIECILNIDGDLYSSIIKKDYSIIFDSYENLNKSIDIYLSEYIELISDLNNYLIDFKSAPSNVTFIHNNTEYNIGFNSLVYLVSQILSSYDFCNNLPEFLTLMPWSVVSDESTVFLTHEDIIDKSIYLNNYVVNNHNLPESINFDEVEISIVQCLDLFTSCIYNINFNIYQSLTLRDFNNSFSSFENIIYGDLEFYEYISLIYELKEYLDEGIVISNLSDLSIGDNIGFNSLLLMEVSILGNYSNDNINNGSNSSISSFSKVYSEYGLPDEVSIIPWIVINNPGKIYNYRTNKVFDSLQEAINDEYTINQDYIGINKNITCENVVINKTIYLSSIDNININFVNCSLWLVCSNSTVEGFTFEGGIVGINGSSCEVMDCIFNGLDSYVFIANCSNVYIGFCEFNNCSSGIIVENSNFTTIESNIINDASVIGVSVVDSINTTIMGNIIYCDGYNVYLDNVTGFVNFNSLVSNSGAFIDYCDVNLTNNWWGCNNPDFASIIYGNVSVNSWLVLSLDCLVDWSSNCSSGTYDIIVIGDLTHNNFGDDTSREYALDNVNMSFSSSFGDITSSDLSEDGFVSVNLNCSSSAEAYVYVYLNNQTIVDFINIPGNTSFGVVNNRSGKNYTCIQEAINDNETVAGDVIILSEGIFTENIFVYKNITLIGNGSVYLNPSSDSMATVTVFGIGGSFENICISSVEEYYAISVYSVGSIFSNCSFSDSYAGIYGMGCINLSITNCSFVDCEYGIYVSSCDNTNLINSSFIGCDYGFYSILGCNTTVSSVVFDDEWIGICLTNETGNYIVNSTFSKACLALEVINSNNTNISTNIFINNIVAYSVYNSMVLSEDNIFNSNILADFSSFDDSDIVLQDDMWSCGPASLSTVLNKLGYTNYSQSMIINCTNVDGNGTNLLNLYNFLKDHGFDDACALSINSSLLESFDIVLLNISGDLHFCVVFNISCDFVVLGDSALGLVNVSRSAFDGLFTGYVLVVNGSNRTGSILSPIAMSSIYGTWDVTGSVMGAYEFLNSDAFAIPGYNNLDKLGTTGWLIKGTLYWTLGIEDDGSMSYLDLGINIISVVSGVGAVTRVAGSFGKLERFEKVVDTLKTMNNLKNNKEYIHIMSKLGDFAFGVDALTTLTDASKVFSVGYSVLLDNSIKYGSSLVSKLYGSSNYKVINYILGENGFVVNYLNNGFRTMSTLLNYNNYKDIYDNAVSFYNTVQPVAKKVVSKLSSAVKSVTKTATKTLKSVAKKASNLVKSVTKKAVKTVKKAVKKVVKTVKKTVRKTVKTVKKVVRVVKKTAQKIVKKVKSAYNYISKGISKLKFW